MNLQGMTRDGPAFFHFQQDHTEVNRTLLSLKNLDVQKICLVQIIHSRNRGRLQVPPLAREGNFLLDRLIEILGVCYVQ
jgi:ATP-dependent 26S proteasome regulatory subunit